MSQGLANRFADAYARFKAGDYKESLLLCATLNRQQPDNTDVLQILGSSQYLLGQLEDARQTYKKLTGRLPGNKEVLNTYGCILRDQNNFLDAIDAYHSALQIDSSYVNAAVNLAYCYHRAEQYDNAIAFYKEIVRLFPKNIEYLRNYGDALYKRENYNEAMEIYESLMLLDPSEEQFLSRRSWCLFYLNEKEQAISTMHTAAQEKTSAFLFTELGKLHLEASQLTEATSALNIATTIAGNESRTLSRVAAAYFQKKHYQLAVDIFKLILEFEPDNFDALNNIGVCYDQLNLNQDAIDYFNLLLTKYPDNAASLTAIGAVYQKMNNRDLAIEYYDKALKIDPCLPTALYNKGVALHENGRYTESSHYFLETLKYRPDHEDAAYNLGINYLADGDYSRGFRHYFKRPRFPLKTDNFTTITPGMDLENKKILFVRSQGLGDELFFLRFVHLVKKKNNKIFYRPGEKIVSICQRITAIDEIVIQYPKEDYDYCFAVDDLPLLLNIKNEESLPPALPLQPTDAALNKIKNMLTDHLQTPLMGITWRAGSRKRQPNPELKYQVLQKEISLEVFCDAIEGYEGRFVILQRIPEQQELDYLHQRFKDKVIDLSELNNNLEDMLALLSLLDRYVGVSNTNLHLREGLQLKTDILVPYPPEWRWQHKTGNSPWFPNTTVFRQTAQNTWDLKTLI